ncbi:Alpha galactosidase precursor [Mycobacteroides abscessus subsp. abscessus]|nr:Alpha galactosidase precursor [Mycobacteroides abscessus subsp. abscessus]
MPEDIRALLINRDLLAIDQDSLRASATALAGSGGTIWTRPLGDGSTAIVIVNRDDAAQPFRAAFSALGLPKARRFDVLDVGGTDRTGGIARWAVSHGLQCLLPRGDAGACLVGGALRYRTTSRNQCPVRRIRHTDRLCDRRRKGPRPGHVPRRLTRRSGSRCHDVPDDGGAGGPSRLATVVGLGAGRLLAAALWARK